MGYNTNKRYAIGQVYFMKFGGNSSNTHAQNGWRPGLIFQNNVGNIYSPNVIALPLTSVLKKVDLPTHVLIRAQETGLKADSMVLCENPEIISKVNIGEYITTLPESYMTEIAVGNLLATSAISFLKLEEIPQVWSKAVELNSYV